MGNLIELPVDGNETDTVESLSLMQVRLLFDMSDLQEETDHDLHATDLMEEKIIGLLQSPWAARLKINRLHLLAAMLHVVEESVEQLLDTPGPCDDLTSDEIRDLYRLKILNESSSASSAA